MARKIQKTYGGANVSIGDAFTEFISKKALEGRSPKTIGNYMQSLNYYLAANKFNEDTPIECVNSDSIYKWLSSMQSNGKKHTTINHYLRDVRTFVYWCMDSEREYITPQFTITEVSGQEPALKAFKKDDIELLLEKPRKSDTFGEWRSWAVVNWIMATGNRTSTICEVQIGDVDFKRKSIYLRHTKNKEYQSVPLSSELSLRLKEYMNLWLRNAQPDDYLFPNVSGERITDNALRHSFAKYCNSRGVYQTNLHGLRHSFADLSLDNGRNPFELQKMLGHETLDMTRKYIKFNNMKAEKDFDKHTPLDTMRKPTSRKRKIQRSK